MRNNYTTLELLERHLTVLSTHNAGRLLYDERSYGDHGFEGAQLTAWIIQRDALQVVLRRLSYGDMTVTINNVSDANRQCPRNVDPYPAMRTRGTDAGAAWVEEAQGFVLDMAYVLADYQELQQQAAAKEAVDVEA